MSLVSKMLSSDLKEYQKRVGKLEDELLERDATILELRDAREIVPSIAKDEERASYPNVRPTGEEKEDEGS